MQVSCCHFLFKASHAPFGALVSLFMPNANNIFLAHCIFPFAHGCSMQIGSIHFPFNKGGLLGKGQIGTKIWVPPNQLMSLSRTWKVCFLLLQPTGKNGMDFRQRWFPTTTQQSLNMSQWLGNNTPFFCSPAARNSELQSAFRTCTETN